MKRFGTRARVMAGIVAVLALLLIAAAATGTAGVPLRMLGLSAAHPYAGSTTVQCDTAHDCSAKVQIGDDTIEFLVLQDVVSGPVRRISVSLSVHAEAVPVTWNDGGPELPSDLRIAVSVRESAGQRIGMSGISRLPYFIFKAPWAEAAIASPAFKNRDVPPAETPNEGWLGMQSCQNVGPNSYDCMLNYQ